MGIGGRFERDGCHLVKHDDSANPSLLMDWMWNMRENIPKILQILDLGPETGQIGLWGVERGCGEQHESVWNVMHGVKQDLKAELWQGIGFWGEELSIHEKGKYKDYR